MKNEEKVTIYKVVIVGESDVGKTCIILRYTDKPFRENTLSTIGVYFLFQRCFLNFLNELY
jgi:Ras-related protein Rab-1A